VPADQYAAADAFIRALYASLGNPSARRSFEAQLAAAREQPWFGYTIASIPRESWVWRFAAATASFDPLPILARVHCPVLLIFGELDPNYPARTSAVLMERALRRGGNRDVTTVIIPGADHSLRVRNAAGQSVSTPLVQQVQHRWVLDRINVDF
jgi:pimeloyl-ACP methyl ester carboxylesterase